MCKIKIIMKKIGGLKLKELLVRINELAGIAKVRELTAEEFTERQTLREEYIKRFRGSMESILVNTTVVDPMGNDVTPEKLREEQERRKQES